MRHHSVPFRATAIATAFALFAALNLPATAWAQNEVQTSTADPPGLVGRVARLSGTVSHHGPGETEWQPASMNWPVSSGDAFWTEPSSGAELQIGPSRVVMDQGTELDVDQLADHQVLGTVAQGDVVFDVRGMAPGDYMQLRTPRGTVTIAQDGQYEIAAGDTEHPTQVSVVHGQAQVAGSGVSLLVASGQTASISGSGPYAGNVGPLVQSPFMTAYAAPPPPPVAQNAPQVVGQMTGGDTLYQTGNWQPEPEYGSVWFPPVEVGWVPYRHGHWAFVAPWGWTWIDDAPWGFAPFHYGRWAEFDGRWGWIPVERGVRYGYGWRPVYAPALVSFIGFGAGVAIGVGIGAAVGWIPLGPREAYHPPYRVSNTYIRNVNITNVTNVTNITNVQTSGGNFVNRGAATMVPAAAVARSQPIAPQARTVNQAALAQARPVGTPGVQPTAATAGVTPGVARQMGLPPTPTPRPVAPGPQARPGTTGAAPALPRPMAPAVARPAVPVPQTVTRPSTGAPTGAPTSVPTPHPGAPGPAIVPRAPGGAPILPTPHPATPGGVTQPFTAGPRPAAPTPTPTPAPGPVTQPFRSGPAGSNPPLAQPGVSRPGVPTPVPQAAPRPTAVPQAVPRPAPVPQVQQPQVQQPQAPRYVAPPTPQVQRPAPVAPQAAPAAPQMPRYTPPPQPAPQVPHYTPPPQPHYQAPAPQPHYQAPAPQPHYQAPAPQPQRQAPKSCPPGHPNC